MDVPLRSLLGAELGALVYANKERSRRRAAFVSIGYGVGYAYLIS